MNTNKDVFTSNLKTLMKENNKTQAQVSSDLAVSFQTFADWYHGRTFPRQDRLSQIAHYFGVEVHQLLIHPDDIIPINNVLKVPVYRSVSCGSPHEENEEVIAYEFLPNSFRNKGDIFCVRANGDSMSPLIEHGDTLVIQPIVYQHELQNEDIVIAKVNGQEFTCKRFTRSGTSIMLLPINPKHPVQIYNKSQIDNEPVTIIGKVIRLMRVLK